MEIGRPLSVIWGTLASGIARPFNRKSDPGDPIPLTITGSDREDEDIVPMSEVEQTVPGRIVVVLLAELRLYGFGPDLGHLAELLRKLEKLRPTRPIGSRLTISAVARRHTDRWNTTGASDRALNWTYTDALSSSRGVTLAVGL